MPLTLPNVWKVAARFERAPATSAQVADVVMNTFTFETSASSDPVADISARLDTFYNGMSTAMDQTIALKGWFSKAVTSMTLYLRAADAQEGWPGEEVVIPFTPTNAAPLPPDCAVVASLRCGPPYTRTRRGRIYFGPLAVSAMDSNGFVSSSLREQFSKACAGLCSASPANPVVWCVGSPTYNLVYPVTEGFVDSSFDTIRRRDPSTETYGRHPNTWATTGFIIG